MRTTINIEDHALELCKQRAAESGQTLGQAISTAILHAYSGRPAAATQRKHKVPTFGQGGLQPGVDLDDSANLQDIMDGLA